ncbi:glycosyl transferase group 1 [Gluconacetobacter diazotrophicus PA1 5]|uniref:glycosyltransferase n=1 Tax=Gluconacetobacter diazotrophicus TaxID=33996 RepID=UPI000173CE15|nr:glycosyltransferase [Gluconacetobacter diazotrophicus]ACI50883.1 glycosyl transferase group 1 [Gluconacetobacter diazotrophicus PA1 5]TWB08663.1 glycosyltransferase involved in cell wall biosynthesis [Gluconacetobacter diazotrophicus]
MNRIAPRPRSAPDDRDLDRAGARLQAARATGLQAECDQLRRALALQDRALSGRVLRIVRAIRAAMRGRDPFGRPLGVAAAALWRKTRRDGVVSAARLVARVLSPPPDGGADGPVSSHDAYAMAAGPADWTPQILIIAELSLAQCAKYRVWQRVEQVRHLGWTCRVVDWRDTGEALTALQFCTRVVFYRVPAFASVRMLLAETRRLSVPSWWEVDDLIFDRTLYFQNNNLAALPEAERAGLLSGVRLFRTCMLSCDRGIASTPVLARAMREAGLPAASVIENALDEETLAAAALARARAAAGHGAADGTVVIVYGSGTRTHDADFRVAVPGLVAAMAADARLRLWIVGELQVPRALQALGTRVVVLPLRPYAEYLALMARADIVIAPLEDSVFNDAKSNIKYLEAASLGLPSVCSPRRAFADVIVDGTTGYLAATDADWTRALLLLSGDATLRRQVGRRALADILDRYALAHMAERQVAAVFGRPAVPALNPAMKPAMKPVGGAVTGRRLRVLCVNVYYPPRAFGGATHVAVEMAQRLQAGGQADIAVLTTRPAEPGRPASALRYRHRGVPVVALDVPAEHDGLAMFHNPAAAAIFADYVAAFRPDVVHVHAPQGLGVGLLDVCRHQGIPYVLTLHDAWWLCDRQFMVREDGQFCGQERIDPRTCQRCRPQARYLADRAVLAGAGLRDAALLLSPSAAHRRLHIANGVDPARIVVHRNGFRWPKRPRTPVAPGGRALRFGYVGGSDAVKGYPVIRAAFEGLARADWVLRLVDNKTALGLRSIEVGDWRVQGKLEVLPAYDGETVDAFFDSIDVLLFPSRWPESYGLTVREALARDVWVVASAPGGQAEDIVPGVNGTLIGLSAPASDLAAAVTDLLDRPDRLAGYVNPCKDRLATWDGQARELLDLLRAASGWVQAGDDPATACG